MAGTLAFIGLFSLANPVFRAWVKQALKWLPGVLLSPGEVFFWLLTGFLAEVATGMLLWARCCARLRAYAPELAGREPPAELSQLLARVATRARALFNAVFLVQNLLDVKYLWAGAALPAGVTYATYAHRGAYPLVAIALLAGVLTVLIFSTGRSAEPGWKWPRILVYLWLGQNVFLIASSILLLGKYVFVYSLTRLRLAAAVWMLLAAAGFCFILIKIVRGKSLRWLVW